MGDTFKNELQKPINNPLLSGAGHGFPFDIFQGSSLLVPVSQENSSVLGDQVGEPDKFVGQDNVNIGTIHKLSDSLDTTVEAKSDQNGDTQPASNNQSYVKLFTSFFGNSQTKQEPESSQGKEAKTNDGSGTTSSVSSSPRSYSPYVNIPNFQTVTPALQVPSVTSSSSALESNPVDPFYSSRPPPYPHQNLTPKENVTKSSTSSEVALNDPHVNTGADDKPPPQSKSSTFTDPGVQGKEQIKQATSFDSYFMKSDSNIDLCSLPNPFPGTLGNYQSPSNFVQKQEQSLDHNTSGSQHSSVNPYFSSASQIQNLQMNKPQQYHNSSSKSVDTNNLKPPLANPNAPPLVSGGSSKNYRLYRLSHHKKPVYAPIPGLSLSTQTSTSSSFLPAGEVSLLSSLSSSPFPGVSSTLINSNVNHPSFSAENNSNPKANIISEQNAPSAASFFNSSFINSGDSIQSSFIQSGPSEVSTSVAMSIPVSLKTESSLPYPYSPLNKDNQHLFAPISKSNPNVSSEANHSALNSVTMHPSGTPIAVPLPSQPVNPKSVEEKVSSPTIIPPSLNHLAHVGRTGIAYRPPYHHWFYKKDIDSKELWYPFSMTDSVALEQTYQSGKIDENTVIATDGGRYDVNVLKRTRIAVYWKEIPREVRRCSWFYKNSNESRYRPYDESISYKLEEEYKKCITTNSWKKKVEINSEEYIIIHSANNIAHLDRNFPVPDGWDDVPDGSQHIQAPVKSVKRGVSDDFDIDDGEAPKVDHLVFVVHGIGSVCDLKFRTIEEAVDVFRSTSHQLIKSHFSSSMKQGLVNRIEILPVSWHSELHGETTGLDKKLESITLKSIPRLRNFTNDTLLDILFYTSPVYCQNIINQVGREITNIFEKFKLRNPNFNGGVSLVGHSLGSLILFDMLCHQKSSVPLSDPGTNIPSEVTSDSKSEHQPIRRLSGFVMGNAGTGQPYIEYPQLSFQPLAFFALGSPIGMFVTVRGIKLLGLDFHFPTCARFFNIFHPFDPVAYRVEALINPELADKRPFLIPHHKGRKRMHLELRDTITRVGADLKQRLVDSIRSTWNTVYQLTALGRADDGLEQEVDKVIEKQMERQRSESVANCLSEQENLNCDLGHLNLGRRIDCVLQEAPLESFNEYVSAIRSHLIYWDSEDTVLMILKEIYNAAGISVDANTVASQGIYGNSSPPSPPSPSLSAVGWNVSINQNVNPKLEPEFQAPSYGFINK